MHLTYHKDDPKVKPVSPASAGEAGALDIEITPEMITAGLDEFTGLYGDLAVEDLYEFARTVLVPTYLRIERARRAEPASPPSAGETSAPEDEIDAELHEILTDEVMNAGDMALAGWCET